MRAKLSTNFDIKLVLAYSAPPALILPETTPEDWLQTLLELCSAFYPDIKLDHFHKHIGPDSTYVHKALLIKKLQIIYHRLEGYFDSVLGKLSENEKCSIFTKLTENIEKCSPGFLNRVNLIIYSMTLPDSLPQLLSRVRKTLVERAALPYDGVHTANYFTRKAKPYYGIEATLENDSHTLDPEYEWLDENIVLAEISSVFERDFTPLNLPQLLCDELRSKLCQLGYGEIEVDPTVGKRNYGEEDRAVFEALIYKCLQHTERDGLVFSSEMNWKIEYDQEVKYFVDLDWDFIRTRFQEALKKAKYVNGALEAFSLAELIEANKIDAARDKLLSLLESAANNLQALTIAHKQLIAVTKQNYVRLEAVINSPDILNRVINLIDAFDKKNAFLKQQQQNEKTVELFEIVKLSLSPVFIQDEKVQGSFSLLRGRVNEIVHSFSLQQIARIIPAFYIFNKNDFKNDNLIEFLKKKVISEKSIVLFLEKMPYELWPDFLKFINIHLGKNFPCLKTIIEFLTGIQIDLSSGENLLSAHALLEKLSKERANAFLKIIHLKIQENQNILKGYQIYFSFLFFLSQEKIASASGDSGNERNELLNYLAAATLTDWRCFLSRIESISILHRTFDLALEDSFFSLRVVLFKEAEAIFKRFPNNKNSIFDKFAALMEKQDDVFLSFSQLLSHSFFFDFVVNNRKIHSYVLGLAVHYSDEKPEMGDAFLRQLLTLSSIVEPEIRCYDADIKLSHYFVAIFSSAQASENIKRQLLAIDTLVRLSDEPHSSQNEFILMLLRKLSSPQLICFFNKIKSDTYKKIAALIEPNGSQLENFEDLRRLLIANLARFNFEKKESVEFPILRTPWAFMRAKNFSGYNNLLKAVVGAKNPDELSSAIIAARSAIAPACLPCFGYFKEYQTCLDRCDIALVGFQGLFQKPADFYLERHLENTLPQSPM